LPQGRHSCERRNPVQVMLMKTFWFLLSVVLSAALLTCWLGHRDEQHYVLHVTDNGPAMLTRYALVGFPEGPDEGFVINDDVLHGVFTEEHSLSPYHITGDMGEKGVSHSFEMKLRTHSKLLLVLETQEGKYYKSYISSLPGDIWKDGLLIPEFESTNYFPPVSLDGAKLEGVSVGIEFVDHTNEHHRTFSF